MPHQQSLNSKDLLNSPSKQRSPPDTKSRTAQQLISKLRKTTTLIQLIQTRIMLRKISANNLAQKLYYSQLQNLRKFYKALNFMKK